MFKNLMNGVSLSALILRAPDDEKGARDKQREELLKNNTVISDPPKEEKEEDEKEEEAEEKEEDEVELDADGNPVEKKEETAEEKVAREATEKVAAKAKRKEDRVQKRIDDITAKAATAEAEVVRLKAQLAADPDKKLTEEEVQTKAEAIAAKKIADKELQDLQDKFNAACDVLQKDAKKVDKEFDDKINDIAEQFGRIPSFMIGVLEDLSNGGEVLAHIANDEDIAEELWKAKPAKMTSKLIEISNKLLEAKKKPAKQISKVPDPVTPVNGNRVVSTIITPKDTTPDGMENYVAKRKAQIAAKNGR